MFLTPGEMILFIIDLKCRSMESDHTQSYNPLPYSEIQVFLHLLQMSSEEVNRTFQTPGKEISLIVDLKCHSGLGFDR